MPVPQAVVAVAFALRAVALAIPVALPAHAAQTYPERPIRFLVPQSPGGASDTVARVVAQRLTERLGQQLVVDNRPGATGNIGHEMVANALGDGYTMPHGIHHLGNIIAFTRQFAFNPFAISDNRSQPKCRCGQNSNKDP